jgi:hypothetical protein
MVGARGVIVPVATIRGYRRPGFAVVTVEHSWGPSRRYRVSLARYSAVRKWASLVERGLSSGAWTRSGFSVTFWNAEGGKGGAG